MEYLSGYLMFGLIVGTLFLTAVKYDEDMEDHPATEELLDMWAGVLIVFAFVWPMILAHNIKLILKRLKGK